MSTIVTHPASFELDALAVDAPAAAEVRAHVASCAVCTQYVDAVRDEVGALVLPELAPAAARPVARKLALRRIAPPLVSLLSAAAVLVLFLRPLKPPPAEGSHAGSMAASASAEPNRFKGNVAMTSIVDRGERQERVNGEVALGPRQRMRVEVAVDHAGPFVIAFLGDDGTYLPLLGPVWLEPGTHLSDGSLGFDDNGGFGVVVAGAPDDVAQARAMTPRPFAPPPADAKTYSLGGVWTLRVRSADKQ